MDDTTRRRIRDSLLAEGVTYMRAWGYAKVNKKNILTDPLYSACFFRMLEVVDVEVVEANSANIKAVKAELLAELLKSD